MKRITQYVINLTSKIQLLTIPRNSKILATGIADVPMLYVMQPVPTEDYTPDSEVAIINIYLNDALINAAVGTEENYIGSFEWGGSSYHIFERIN